MVFVTHGENKWNSGRNKHNNNNISSKNFGKSNDNDNSNSSEVNKVVTFVIHDS